MVRRVVKSKRLRELEREIKRRGVHLAYERLQFAGLRLNSGMCLFKGEYYLFVDLRKSNAARIELLEGALAELEEIEAAGGPQLLEQASGRSPDGEEGS